MVFVGDIREEGSANDVVVETLTVSRITLEQDDHDEDREGDAGSAKLKELTDASLTIPTLWNRRLERHSNSPVNQSWLIQPAALRFPFRNWLY